jgi:hypothetical protein
MASMKKEEAKRAVLSEYDRWAKKHPNDARMMGAFSSTDTYRKKNRTFSISVPLAMTSGKSFRAGFGIGWKIRLTHPNKAKCAVPSPKG